MGSIPVVPFQNEAGIFRVKPQKFLVRSLEPFSSYTDYLVIF